MTDEAQGQNPEDTPAPPASTRWSEDPVPDEDVLAAPYVPGREAAAPAPGTEEATSEPVASGVPAEVDEVEDEPFPFEAPEDDFPFDQFDIEGAPESAVAEEPAPPEQETPAEEQRATETVGWSPADLDMEEEEDTGWEPFAEPAVEAEPTVEAAPAAESEPTREAEPVRELESVPEPELVPVTDAGSDAENEVAVLLDRLARLVRDEGEEALRREMESSDRLASLISGLLAGYLSGRG